MHKPLQEGVPAGRQRWAPLLDLFLPRDAEQSTCVPVMQLQEGVPAGRQRWARRRRTRSS